MFAKLKENKLFKSLSETLCSIELIETKDRIPASRHYPHSAPHPKEADKATDYRGKVTTPPVP